MLVLEKTMKTGVAPKHHVALQITISRERTAVTVASYASDFDVVSWHDEYELPAGIALATLEDAERALAQPGQPFAGAYLVRQEDADLQTAQARKWGEVKQRSDAVISRGCLVLDGTHRADTDERSLSRLNLAATAAQTAIAQQQAWSDVWTMADDAEVLVTAEQMVRMQQQVTAFVAACHARRRQLRGQIGGARTAEQLSRIDVLGGWPE